MNAPTGLQRFERITKSATIIADPFVTLGAGVYNDDNGKPHVCLHFLDPERDAGRMVYVVTPDAAAQIIEGLVGALQRVNGK